MKVPLTDPARIIDTILINLNTAIANRHPLKVRAYYAGQLDMHLRRHPQVVPQWDRAPLARTYFTQGN